MNFNHNFSSRFRILSKGRVVLAISVIASNLLHAAVEQNALPTNPVIVSGNIGISSSAPNNLSVNQSTNKGIINWGTFDIGSTANVQFNQPSVNASTLNRVVGSNLSEIAGTLSANGKVILINPNGVIFSKGSSVDVGGIVASTLDLSDENYLNNNYAFTRNGSTGKVLNYGEIIAQDKGFVALLAPEVINEGVVIARAGTVAFAAGDKVTLDFSGDGLLKVEVDPSTINTLIQNKNLVIADSGIVYMSTKAANDLQNSVISNSGTIQANSIQEVGGKIILTGDDITLESTSIIEAKGAKGGGEVLVGGDWQGSNDVYQATTVTMEEGAIIDASATQNGDGGKVVLWSDITNADSVTTVEGTILAKAGSQGGDGGQIETSGHSVKVQNAIIEAGAPKGENGLWLVDPDEYLDDGTAITNALNNGTNYTWLNSGGRIYLRTDIIKTSGGDATFTLQSSADVKLDPNVDIVSNSNKLHVVLWSDSDSNGDGAVMLDTSATIKTNGGNITIGGGSSPYSGYADNSSLISQGVLINSATLDAQGGNISILGSTDAASNEWGVVIQGTVKTSGSGNITINGQSTSSGPNPYGVLLRSTGTNISAQNGTINITGKGWGHDGNSRGVVLENNSMILVSGSGAINIIGNAQSSVGIDLRDTSRLYNDSGQITLQTDQLLLASGTLIYSNGASQAELSIIPYNSGRNIGISTTGARLNIPASYLSTNFQNGFKKITIGSTSSGIIIIGGNFSFNDPLSLISSGQIETSSGGYSIITGNNNDLTVSSPTNIWFDHIVNLGSGSLIKEGTGKLINDSNANHTYNSLLINNGNVQMNADAFASPPTVYVAAGAQWTSVSSGTVGTISGAGSISDIVQLTIASPNGETFSGTLSSFYNNNASNVIKNGSGLLTLSGYNSSYGGIITVNAGTLIASNSLALGTSSYGTTVSSGATLQVGAAIGAEPINLNGGTLSIPSGVISLSGAITLGANSTISVGGTQLSLSGVISDGAATYGFTKTGSGNLILSGTNTYDGATIISAGSLYIGGNNVIPDTSALTLSSGTNFYLNNYSETIGSLSGAGNVSLGGYALTTGGNNSNTTYSGIISGTGSLVKNGYGTFIFSGNNTYSGTTTINSGTLQLGSGGTSGNISTGNVILSSIASFLKFNRSGIWTFANNISGAGNVSKDGSSTLTLSGNNSYTRTTTINNGELIVTSNTGLGTTAGNTDILNGAILDLKNVSIGDENIYIQSGSTLKTSSGISSVSGVVSPGTIEVSSGAQLTLSGKFEDDNTNTSITKNGAGTLILTNDTNNYGSTIINAGTLQVGNGGTTGKLGRLGVTNNGTLYINRSDSLSLSSIISSTSGIIGTGNVTAHIGGALYVDRIINLSGANSKITLAAGYNALAGTELGSDVTLTDTITTSNTGTVTIFQGNTNTSNLNLKIVGATGTTRYKTYNANNTAILGAVAGTRNFDYRADPTLTVSDLTASKTYDGNTNAATSLLGGTVSGSIDGDPTYTMPNLALVSAAYSNKDVGSRTLSATYTAPTLITSGYSVSGYSVNAYSQVDAGTINKKTVSLSGAKIYNGNTVLGIGEVAIGTGVGTETLAFSGATVNDIHVVTAGKYIDAITLEDGLNGGLASNYQLPTLDAANAAVTISAKTLTPTISNTGVTKVYDGTADGIFTPTYTYSGFVIGDSDATLSNSTMVYNNSHVALANKITVSGLSIDSITSNVGSFVSDYILDTTSKDVAATITPATLTPTINNIGVTKVYDGLTTAPTGFIPTYNITGFVSGDTAATITNTGSVYNDAHVENANKVIVSGLAVSGITGDKGSQVSDYKLDAVSKDVSAVITPKDLTPIIASLSVNKTYDGTVNGTNTLYYSYDGTIINGQAGSGLISGDTNAALTHTSYIYDSKDAGVASKVTVSGLQVDSITGTNGSLKSDYALTTNTLEQNGSIGKKQVTLSASKIYDGTTSLTNAVFINTSVAGEELAYSNAVAGSANVLSNGINQITSITLKNNGSVLASNYKLPTLNLANAPVNIIPALLTITANSNNKAYDAIPYFGGKGVVYNGFVNGESTSVLNGILAYKGNSQSAVNTGVYDITPYGLSNSNYNVKFINGTLIIDPQKVIPIPNVPKPVVPPITQPVNDGTNTPDVKTSKVNEISKPLSNQSSNNSMAVMQEQRTEGSVTFDGMVIGSTQTGTDVKAIIIQGATSSKVPFTLLVNVKVGEGFKFIIPSDIVNQVNTLPASNAKPQVNVTLTDGNKIPSWLIFDENSMSFSSTNVPSGSFPLSVNLKIGTGVDSKTIEVIIK